MSGYLKLELRRTLRMPGFLIFTIAMPLVMYLVFTTLAFIIGGLFAMALRIEHLTPDRTIMGPNTYNRMFTLHGVVMIFLFMIPAVPGVYVSGGP